MPDLGQTIDKSEHDDPVSFEIIPPGEYVAMIVDSDIEPNKAATGHFVKLEYEIIEGEHKGRKLWGRYNFDNPNEKAVEIAKRELAAIGAAVAKPIWRATEELHDKPLVVTVKVDTRDKDRGPQNEIKGWKPTGQAAATQPTSTPATTQATPQAQQAPASNSALPWAK